MQGLFELRTSLPGPAETAGSQDSAELSQWMTSQWVADRLVETYFPFLGAGDVVLEPTAGRGAFLCSIPDHVEAFGVEIDERLATEARAASGRQVITGDILSVVLPKRPSAILGNPPFKLEFVTALLRRAHDWLPDGCYCGLVLPAYLFQTAATVMDLRRGWEIRADHMPRNVFPSLKQPLVFAMFRRGGTALIGFTLYEEAVDVSELAERFRALLARSGRSPWRRVVAQALKELGGEATLEQLYGYIRPRRPTGNPYWMEKVRQTLQRSFEKTGKGRYTLPALEAA